MNIINIPKEYEIFGNTVNVIKDDKFAYNCDKLGISRAENCKIIIATDVNIPKDQQINTFFHEFIHNTLYTIGYDNLSGDERFISCLSGAIHQMLKTAKY